jgi:hypothetical protein
MKDGEAKRDVAFRVHRMTGCFRTMAGGCTREMLIDTLSGGSLMPESACRTEEQRKARAEQIKTRKRWARVINDGAKERKGRNDRTVPPSLRRLFAPEGLRAGQSEYQEVWFAPEAFPAPNLESYQPDTAQQN